MGVIDPDELAKGIVGVGGHLAVARLRGDVPAGIVGVGEVHGVAARALRDARHQRRGAVRAIAAGHEGIGSGIPRRAVGQRALLDAAKFVIFVGDLVQAVVELHLGHAVVDVVGIGGLVRRAKPAFTHFLAEAVEVGMAGVLQRGAVEAVAVRADQRTLAGAVREVVFRLVAAPKVVVMDARRHAVRAVLVGVAVGRFIVIAQAGDTVEIVVGILHLAAVAILHLLKQAIAVVFVDVRGKHLRAYLHRGLAAEVVIIEGVGDVRGRVVRGVVADRLDAVLLVGVGVLVGLAVGGGLHAGDALGVIVGIADRLAGGVGDAVELAGARVGAARHSVAAGVLRGQGEVAVRGVGLLGADVGVGRLRRVVRGHAVVHATGTGAIAELVVVVVIDDLFRRALAQQQVFCPLGVCFSVPGKILVGLDIFTTRLYPAIEVVLAVILHMRFHARQIGGGGDIAPVGATVTKADAERLTVEEEVRELGVVAVAGVGDHEADLDKVNGNDEAVARILPADPFRVKRAQGMV